MSEVARSERADVRNPLLQLEEVADLRRLPAETRSAMSLAFRAIQRDARARADKCWRTHKAPMAVYWKAVGVYAGHLARVLDRPAA